MPLPNSKTPDWERFAKMALPSKFASIIQSTFDSDCPLVPRGAPAQLAFFPLRARTQQTVLSAAKLLGRYSPEQNVRGCFLDTEGGDGSPTNAAEFAVLYGSRPRVAAVKEKRTIVI